ncbi:MAG: T9SS type A sorting domain-containing protein [Bacteroidales bacterium]|nr:T9SS type A sorting domain-containing protein [Bacteroidales bacterium]
MKRFFTLTLAVLFGLALNAIAQPGGGSSGASTTYDYGTAINGLWSYNSSSDVYYIVGLFYCASPADEDYEQMGIFVPGAYMDATSNGDGTYTCTLNTSGTVNGYTASSAPIVFPVNTSGYSAQSAPSGYSSTVATYTNNGFIYLWAGCRGRDHGAPLGVTDMKAAIRYYRYLETEQQAVPGNTDLIFTFGHSGGGAQSSLLGASGNNSLYDDYLEAIDANMDYDDNVCGSMCWCPITNLDQGDGAYEWNMGLTRSSLGSADQSISKGLAASFAEYVNAVGFKHPDTGETLSLSSTSDGYYQSGSYYEYVMEVINDAVTRYNSYNSASVSTYSTTDEDALYEFASAHKTATKGLGAFDDYDNKGQAENTLFGIEGTAGHFNKFLAELVQQYASSYYSSFTADLASTNVDAVGKTVEERLMMYSPLYYLVDNDTYYEGGGQGSSTVAKYWRIRTGITQGDAPLNTEINLALALQNYSGVKDVDFETIWNQGHTEAEDSGSASSNFISWVEECAAATNVEEQNETSMTIYPNPAKGMVTIKTIGDLTIYNSLGQVVKQIHNVEGQTRISTQELSSGLYFVKSNDAVKKLIVE